MSDLADLDARIAAAAAAVGERESVGRRIAEVDRALRGHEDAVSRLVAEHRLEEADVERLEGLTLGRVLSAVRGSRDDDLARERAERDKAAYRLAEERARRDLVLRERAGLVARHDALAGAVDEQARALAAKEAFLGSAGGPVAAELLALAEERGALEAELREVDEALAAARDAGQALDEVAARLGSASGWSTYDTWLGGGAISSAVKHDRLDKAQRAASYAESRLAVLRRELADVGVAGQVTPDLGITSLTKFVDIWFDNIFTDWSVASRIGRARDTTAAAGRAVASVVTGLLERRAAVVDRADRLAARRAELLSSG